MSQEGAPGRQQALPERLVCNWEQREEEGEQCEHHCKRPRGLRKGWAQHSSQQRAHHQPWGVWRDHPTHFYHWWLQSNWGRREQSLPRGHCRGCHSTGAGPGLAEMQLREKLAGAVIPQAGSSPS